jgi:hypothetical protein
MPHGSLRLVRIPDSALALAVALVSLGIVKYGLQLAPEFSIMFEVANNWSSPASGPLVSRPTQDYVVANGLPAMLLGFVGLSGRWSFTTVSVLLAAIVIVTPLVMPSVRNSVHRRRLIFVLVAGGGPSYRYSCTG